MSLTVANIIEVLNEWAPKWTAWEKDNVGLQVGNLQSKVTKILVTLDVSKQVVQEAIHLKVELIISHHPLLFRPPSAITAGDPIGELVLRLAKQNISLFSAHTNLDHAHGGVSFALAETLGLQEVRFLSPLNNSLAKIIIFVPEGYVEQILSALTAEGAGVIGNYSSCSFGAKGTGSFRGSSASNPFSGKKDQLEFVDETRLEMIAPRAILPSVVAAIRRVHPYEEPAYDIYAVENPHTNFGMGALGRLPRPRPLRTFLSSAKRILGANALRFTGNLTRPVQSIAVCGGAGSDLLPDAIAAKADVFLTADVKYHVFQKAQDTIALVDAGHWETERVILKPLVARLYSATRALREPLKVFITKQNTNPVKFI
jgi:dinuclear metal center YbgI/SA1388 family protein